MDAPSTLHMREYYAFKHQSQDHDNTTYMKSTPGKHLDKYFRDMHDNIPSLIRRKKLKVFPRKDVDNHTRIYWY